MAVTGSERAYDWNRSEDFGRTGVSLTFDLLLALKGQSSWYHTLSVLDVTDSEDFQKLGIDLVWLVKAVTCSCAITIEVKADRHIKSGNLFFETLSDVERNTPGAFLATTAEWYFYTFPTIDTVYCLPLLDTREWFINQMENFELRTVKSVKSNRQWATQGRLVEIARIVAEVPGVRCFRRERGEWNDWSGIG